ncbi:MAG: hypothetical protein ACO225_11610 [Ilumatobacteraceae bacterium]
MRLVRSSVLVVIVGLTASACGSAAPPAKELADELIATLDVSDAVKACMTDAVESFTLTEEQAAGFEDFDDVATKAAAGNELALRILVDFEDSLAACR